MGYKPGHTVIVTAHGTNHVGIIATSHIVNKQVVYDVLLESRRAIVYVGTSKSLDIYVNKELTAKLCDTDQITCTVPYKELIAAELMPHLDANSAGKASW
jgi:hypothetical protein